MTELQFTETDELRESGLRIVSRYEACFYHFLISLLVFAGLAYLILYQWYPGFFYAIDGGWEGMRIIVGVDLILGPILTLVVFKAGKPGLRFDLTMVAITQSLCLIAGTFVVYSERPLFFIYYDNHFYSCSTDTFTRYGVPTPDPSLYSENTPANVMVVLPEDPIELADYLNTLYQSEIPPWVNEASFRQFGNYVGQVINKGTPEKVIRKWDVAGNMDRWLDKHGGSFDDYAFIPIHSRYRDAFVGLRKADKAFIDIVEIQPPNG